MAGEIKKGETVEVVFDGAVGESCPVQGKALNVAILESAENNECLTMSVTGGLP